MLMLSKTMRPVMLGLALAICSSATLSGTTFAQDVRTPDPDAVIRLMKPDHIMIGARDWDAMATWYRDKLDFVVEKVWTVDDLEGIQLGYLTGQGFRIELIGGGKGGRMKVPNDFAEHFNMGGIQHIAFAVEDVDETMAELARRGVEPFVPATSFPEGAERRVAFIKDPEGNVIEFATPIPSVR